MSSYCGYDPDVKKRTPHLVLRDAKTGVTATTPSLTEADGLVEDIGADIDGHLARRGYEVPATSPVVTGYLALTNALGAAAAVLRAANPERESPTAAVYEEQYAARLADIDSGLLDAALASAAGGAGIGLGYDFDRSYDVLGSKLNDGGGETMF